ncbi:hypothetical protein RN001_012508 [Aquatica leii]|uniref:Uncharacterized protein n=1 Tax=Aquatica leii TaxID=1421715 RepID=A0AAN7P6A7_9COLE|nr:hypothetical protein RN001_012508 [Aquatica leii]
MLRTRNDTLCPIFGVLTPFKENVLTTYADVIKYYSWLRLQKLNKNKQEPSVSDVCKKLYELTSVNLSALQLQENQAESKKYNQFLPQKDFDMSSKSTTPIYNVVERKCLEINVSPCAYVR